MQSILFAIILVLVVNIQPAEAQSTDLRSKIKSRQRAIKADQMAIAVKQRAIKVERRGIKDKQMRIKIELQEIDLIYFMETNSQKLEENDQRELEINQKANRNRKEARELNQKATEFKARAEELGQRAIELDFFAEMQESGHLSTDAVLFSDSLAFQYIDNFRKEFLAHLIKAFTLAIGAESMEQYLAVSNLSRKYGYNASEMIESSSLSMFDWMWMMANAPSNQRFFTNQMKLALGSAIAEDRNLLPRSLKHIVNLQERAKDKRNRSAFRVLYEVDKFLLGKFKESDNNRESNGSEAVKRFLKGCRKAFGKPKVQ